MDKEEITYSVVMHNPTMWCVYSHVTKNNWLGGKITYKNFVGEFPSEELADGCVEMLESFEKASA